MEANTYIYPSLIHGLGLFAAKDIEKGELIVQGSLNISLGDDAWLLYLKSNKRPSNQLIGGFCMINHCEAPNTVRVYVDGNEVGDVIASRNIKAGEEITEDYYQLPNAQNPFMLSEFYKALEDAVYRWH